MPLNPIKKIIDRKYKITEKLPVKHITKILKSDKDISSVMEISTDAIKEMVCWYYLGTKLIEILCFGDLFTNLQYLVKIFMNAALDLRMDLSKDKKINIK